MMLLSQTILHCKRFFIFFAECPSVPMFSLAELIFFYFTFLHSAPYLSVAQLQVETLTTVMYDRRKLCQSIGLATAQLPLLACLLGNDVVSEVEMQHIRNEAMSIYRCLEF